MRISIGLEKGFGESLEYFENASVTIHQVEIIPLDPSQYPVKNESCFANETDPDGLLSGQNHFAQPNEYP